MTAQCAAWEQRHGRKPGAAMCRAVTLMFDKLELAPVREAERRHGCSVFARDWVPAGLMGDRVQYLLRESGNRRLLRSRNLGAHTHTLM